VLGFGFGCTGSSIACAATNRKKKTFLVAGDVSCETRTQDWRTARPPLRLTFRHCWYIANAICTSIYHHSTRTGFALGEKNSSPLIHRNNLVCERFDAFLSFFAEYPSFAILGPEGVCAQRRVWCLTLRIWQKISRRKQHTRLWVPALTYDLSSSPYASRMQI
jgi:hypothetical protein